MADDHHAFARMEPMQIEQSVDDPILNLAPALAAGNGCNAAAVAPHLPPLILADLIGGQSSPLAKIELDHVLAILDRQSEPVGEDLGSLARALQWARVERIDLFLGKTARHRGDFGAP